MPERQRVSGWTRKKWAFRTPLDLDASPEALAYWIEKAETDDWTYDDLRRLVGVFLDNDRPLPPALERWAIELAADRHARPSRRGPKSNLRRDAAIAVVVQLMIDTQGISQREAFRQIGTFLNLSPEAVESATLRGRSA